MKISILTPSYNQANFLEHNIQSIMSQGLGDGDQVEHIVMDGGSTDESFDILRKYPHLIWRSERDRGQTHALNKALALSTGGVIGWVNSDDMLPPNALLTVAEFFKRYPEQHVLVGNLEIIDENSKLLYKIPSQAVTFDGLLNGRECVTQTSTFFRRTVFETVGIFNEDLHYGMDHEFFLRVAKRFRFCPIDADLGAFRKYADSKTGSSAIEFIKDRIAIRRMHGGKFFSSANILIAYMLISEPLRHIKWIRQLVRRFKGVNQDFVHYP